MYFADILNSLNSRTYLVVDSASHYFLDAFISDGTRIDNYGTFDAMETGN